MLTPDNLASDFYNPLGEMKTIEKEPSLALQLTGILRKLKDVFTSSHRFDVLVASVIELLPADGCAFVAWLPEKPDFFEPLIEIGMTIPNLSEFPRLTGVEIKCLYTEKMSCTLSRENGSQGLIQTYLAETGYRHLLLIPYAGGYGNFGVLLLAGMSETID